LNLFIGELYKNSVTINEGKMSEKINLEKYCNETQSWLSDIAEGMNSPGTD